MSLIFPFYKTVQEPFIRMNFLRLIFPAQYKYPR